MSEVLHAAVSARELEVLGAVAQHRTNAEIAAELVISTRTVESHVSSLLRKLQVSDRRALAALSPSILREGEASPAVGRRYPTRGLPVQLTSFVGRRADRAALATALAEHRLVTSVGPGGVGKTRLALAVAEDHPGDVCFVSLAAVPDPSLVGPAIAAAYGLDDQEPATAVRALTRRLATVETLLVLDSGEHVSEAMGILLEGLLQACPRLVVHVTSRARLMVPFEWSFPVSGLSCEPTGDGPGDAVALFLSRAAAGGADIEVVDLARVRRLCRCLDGMPLAIEQAAARLSSLGLDGLEAGLSDRLALLTGGDRADRRHRSLRSTLDWSYGLLDEPSRAVLRRLSVFPGPFAAREARGVAGWTPASARAVPALLAGLAERSLLVTAVGSCGTRYSVPESVRQYGADLLRETGEDRDVRSRYLRRASRWSSGGPGVTDLGCYASERERRCPADP
jgi:predicted ATPase/DNA-binding CsgD family transcriptional regulator